MNQELALNILKSGRNVFLTGQAGSGKTYVLNAYIRWLWACDVPVAITASTGIAATHIGGVTIHSWSGMGIKEFLSDDDIDTLASKKRVRSNIFNTKVLIIDEISMLSAQLLDNVDRILRAVLYDERPWGGLQVVFCGDFFQLPPVSRYRDGTKRFAFASKAWNASDLAFCYLNTQYRQSDTTFSDLLNALRIGQVSSEMIEVLRSRMHVPMDGVVPVRLFTHNVDVDRINAEELESLPGEFFTYEAQPHGDKKLAHALLKGLLTPEVLELKIKARVLFVKNNPGKGYMNGTMGVVRAIDEDTGYPLVETLDGHEILVEPEKWSIENEDELLASIVQVPLKLAWAITVHKSQGMTLDAAEIDLSKSFESGQSYVALSRVKSLGGLRLLGLNEKQLSAHPLVVRGDAYFFQQSHDIAQELVGLSSAQRESYHKSFVELSEGSFVGPEEIAAYAQQEKPLAKAKKKRNTLMITAELITQGKSFDEIVKIRGLTVMTVLEHCAKIKVEYPQVVFSSLKPSDDIYYQTLSAIQKASEDKNNFSDQGTLRLKPIYELLDGAVSYDDIRLCLLFAG